MDVDLLLEAQSSDDENDPASHVDADALDRRLEEILNSAEDAEPSALSPKSGLPQVHNATDFASIRDRNVVSGDGFGSSSPKNPLQGISAAQSTGTAVMDDETSYSGSSINVQDVNSAADLQFASVDLPRNVAPSSAIEASDRLKSSIAAEQSHSETRSSAAEMSSLRLSPVMSKSRMWEVSGKQTPSSLLPRRPGAAVAAAAAASRQAATPHSAQTKYKRESLSSELTPKRMLFGDESSEDPGSFVQEVNETQNAVNPALLEGLEFPVSDTLVDQTSMVLLQANVSNEVEDYGTVTVPETLRRQHAESEDRRVKEQTSPTLTGTSFTDGRSTVQSEKTDSPESNCATSLSEEEMTRDPAVSDLLINDNDINSEDDNQSTEDVLADSSDDSENHEAIVSLLSIETSEAEYQSKRRKDVARSEENLPMETGPTKPHASKINSEKSASKIHGNALDIAEETEKKAASSGLHIKEGAAAQPMRLEGIERGPPTIGYLQIDTVGLICQILAAPSTLRDHGTGQALALHGNYIAVGLSKGNVLLAPMKNTAGKLTDSIDMKTAFLSNVDKSHAAVTSMSFSMQGDLLLVGYANGSLILWDVPRAVIAKSMNVEHNVAIVHAAFLGQDLQSAKYPKAITADCKGLVLLHSFTVVPLLRRFSVTTQCLVDGQRTGMVLSLSPLLFDYGFDTLGGSNVLQPSATVVTSTGLSSMMGGMVGGVVAGKNSDVGKKISHDGGSVEEAGGVVVFVTHQTVLVVRLTPSVEVYAKLSRPDGVRDGGIPYVAWRRLQSQSAIAVRGKGNASVIQGVRTDTSNKEAQSHGLGQVDAGKNTDAEGDGDNYPMLALAWDKKVFVLQLSKGELKIVEGWDLDSVACGVAWLEEQMVVVLTAKEQICLFTKEGVEVERGAVESEELRRNSAISYHTHILNTFGNPEKTYHNSLAARAATLYLLGPLQLWRACLLPWQDRIKALQNAGDWMGAFHIGMEVYDGRALGVIGLPKRIDLLREAVAPTLLSLLSAYIDEVFTYLSLSLGNPSMIWNDNKQLQDTVETHDAKIQAKEQYARVGGVAIEFCVHIGRTDVLFDLVFNKFCSIGQRGTFLELLEPYILKDTLGVLAPEVMQALVEYYSQRGWLQRVEQCVLRMDIASLDFNQVVRLCRDNGLYSALIYLFNKGLDDFKSPLEELLVVAQDISKPNAETFGYKMFVYLKYCFLGLAFPPGHGQIHCSRLPALRAELLECLLDDKALSTSKIVEEVPRFGFTIHPRLSFLLSFDLPATLEVLHCAFPKDGPLGIGNDSLEQKMPATGLEESEGIEVVKDGLQLLQAVVDALIDILERVHLSTVAENLPHVEVDARRLHMSKNDVGHVMEFIAQFVASKHAKVSRVILTRIVEYLASCDDSNAEFLKKRKDEDARKKENLMVRLLKGVPESEWDSFHALELALRAQFWQASACLLAKKGDYIAALDSHLKDRDQPHNAFIFILDILNPSMGLSESTLAEFRGSILARLPELLQLSSEATLVIMLKHFNKEHKLILSDLAPYPPLLFQYLKQIMSARADYKYNSSHTKDSSTLPAGEKNGHLMKDDGEDYMVSNAHAFLDGNETLSDLLQSSGLEFTNEMEEMYVELLCQFEPKSVLKFLKSFEDYRLEHCLKLCQDYGITDAAAYLFERVGDIGSALSLVLADMDLHIHEMDLSIAQLFARHLNLADEEIKYTEHFLKIPEIAATRSVMQVAIELCQRNTWRMYPVESEALWFRLLDRFVDPLRKLHNARRDFRRRKLHVADARFKEMENKVKKVTEGVYKWKVVMISSKAVDLMRKVLVYLMDEIVNGMMGYIPLSVIMDKLLSDNGSHEFGDFKGTILGMLGSYGYEQTILFTAKHVVEDDTFHNISIYKRRLSQAYAPNSSICCVCNHKLDDYNSSIQSDNSGFKGRHAKAITDGATRNGRTLDKDAKSTARNSAIATGLTSVIVFFCGHTAHRSCVCLEPGTSSSRRDISNSGCPVCAHKVCLSDLSSVRRKHKYTPM